MSQNVCAMLMRRQQKFAIALNPRYRDIEVPRLTVADRSYKSRTCPFCTAVPQAWPQRNAGISTRKCGMILPRPLTPLSWWLAVQ